MTNPSVTPATLADTFDAARAADAAVLNGVGTSPAKPGRKAPAAKPAAKKPAAKPAASVVAKAPAAIGAARYGTGYATPRAMAAFTRWIAREYPDLFPVPYAKLSAAERARYERLVSVASKAYRYFQASDLNR